MLYFYHQIAIKIDATIKPGTRTKDHLLGLSPIRLLYVVVYWGSYVFKGHCITPSHNMILISDANSPAMYCRVRNCHWPWNLDDDLPSASGLTSTVSQRTVIFLRVLGLQWCLSQPCLKLISKCILDISIWIPNRNLKVNRNKIELLIALISNLSYSLTE